MRRPTSAIRLSAREFSATLADLPWITVGRVGAVLNNVFGPDNTQPLGILTYHRITDVVSGLPKPLHNVTPQRFRQQISGLLSRGYRIWPLKRALEAHTNKQPISDKAVVITFDDGYQSVYTNALPILSALGVPATVFVSTSFLGSGQPFPFDEWGTRYQETTPVESWAPLTIEQCEEMIGGNTIEIGAHTHTHQDFRCQPDAFRRDLQESVDLLQERFGLHDIPFAFPYGCPYKGFASADLVDAAKSTGVTCGLTSESVAVDLETDPFQWGRFTAFPWDTGGTLAAKVEGWYEWAPKLRRSMSRLKLSEIKLGGSPHG